MSQDELAAKLGKSRSLISQWENGRTRLPANDVTHVAAALRCSVEWLYYHDLPDEVYTELSEKMYGTATNPLQVHHSEIDTAGIRDEELYKKQVSILLSAFEDLSTEDRKKALRIIQAIKD